VNDLWHDVRHGLRTLAKSPGFTLVALLTLALGIGANTAIFSAVDRILLHPLPYPQPDRIMAISRTGGFVPIRHAKLRGPVPGPGAPVGRPHRGPHPKTKRMVHGPAGPAVHMRGSAASAPAPKGPEGAAPTRVIRRGSAPKGPVRTRSMRIGGPRGGKPSRSSVSVFSYPDYEQLRAHSDAFEEVAAYHEAQVTLTRRGEPTSIRAVVASPSLFRLLRARPLLGRLFTAQDDREGAPPVVVIGQDLWRNRFSGDPNVIGATIELNNRAYTVVGVLPASLRFPPFIAQTEAWIPLVSDPLAQIQQVRLKRGFFYLSVICRLKPGIPLRRANAELATLADRLAGSFPADAGFSMEAAPLAQKLVKNYRLALLVLFGAVGLVLLIACANVANLLLARASVRERDLALRLALGAGRARIVRQMLVESVELSLAGGAAGVFLAYLAVSVFVGHLPPTLQEFQNVSVSGTVLAFAALVSVAAGIVMGLLPAWRLSDLRIQEILKGSGKAAGAGLVKGRLREALVVIEVALAVVLLAGAGLLLRSFGNLVSVPLGFQPRGVLMARANLSAAGYHNPGQWKSFVSTELQRLRAQPGVLQAAAATSPPMSGMRIALTFSIPGHPLPPDEVPAADLRAVTPGYFELMRIPLLRGRAFRDTDADSSAHACVVNQAFVERYFPGVDPLTRQLRAGMPPAPCRIIGVVGNVISGSLSGTPGPAIYVPFAQSAFFAPSFLVRSAGNPGAMASVLREQLHALNAALPVAPATLAGLLSRSLARQRLRTMLVALFAVLAILLAAVGIWGVLGYSVSRRTQEIGVRMAIGATPAGVLRQIVGEGLRLVTVGAVLGNGAALGLTRFMRSLLYPVGSADAVTYMGVALVLLLVAILACALPAIRASRVDPTVALRYE
jgi:putative ABC transport system permease protein